MDESRFAWVAYRCCCDCEPSVVLFSGDQEALARVWANRENAKEACWWEVERQRVHSTDPGGVPTFLDSIDD